MSGKSRIRSTVQQLKLLTDYMATHPTLAHGEFTGPQGKLREQRQWDNLRIMLKEHGPDKSIEQWKVTWRDMRRKARTEGSIANRAMNRTGNATAVPILSDTTTKILGIMGSEGAFGISGGEESGIGSTSSAGSITVGQSQEVVIEETITYDEEDGSATEFQHSAYNETTQHATPEEASGPLPRHANQTEPGRATVSDPVSRITDQSPATGQSIRNQRIGQVRRIVRQQQLEPRARANQFLQAELETNNVLKDVVNQLEIANRYSAIRSRIMFKERLWRLRKDFLNN